MLRCIDCGGPVEDYMIQSVKDPKTGLVDVELLLCSGCDVVSADGFDVVLATSSTDFTSELYGDESYGDYDGIWEDGNDDCGE
jgi:hypothetical protein